MRSAVLNVLNFRLLLVFERFSEVLLIIEDLRLLNFQGSLRGNELGQPLKNFCRWLNRGALPSAPSNLRKDPALFDTKFFAHDAYSMVDPPPWRLPEAKY